MIEESLARDLYNVGKQTKSLNSQLDWVSKNIEELRKQHKDKWVAIKDNKVVASAPNVKVLMETIPEDVDNPFVTYISSDNIIRKFVYASESRSIFMFE